MNRKEIYRKGYTYVVTRRIVQRKTETVLRVRVRACRGLLLSGTPVLNEFRDYPSVCEGDMVFSRHIARIESE